MMRTVLILISIVAFSILQFSCSASREVSTNDLQENPPAKNARRVWQITQSNGWVIPQAELRGLIQDSLIISDTTGIRVLPIRSITEIRFVSQFSLWKGAKTGAEMGCAAGLVTGVVAGVLAKPTNDIGIDGTTQRIIGGFLGAIVYGTVFFVVGGTIGGIVGAVSGTDEVYDVSAMTLDGKLRTIQAILDKERNGADSKRSGRNEGCSHV